MITSDLIAIGILVICIVLAMFGVLSLLVLSCIGLLADNPKFDELSRGAFRGGKVIPCIRSQVRYVGEFLSKADEEPQNTVAMSQ